MDVTAKASATTSGNLLDTCLDYSLTIYVMQRAASVIGFADANQQKGRCVVTQINREL
jgi:hypothetical protein